MTTLERLELLKQDLFNGVEASGRAHQQIINVLKAHIDEVKKEATAQQNERDFESVNK